jgi:uncharacterized membrane-anchored protein
MFDILATAVDYTKWNIFLVVLLLVFGLFLILAGIFTAYFGSGKSRTIGVVLLVVGLVVGLFTGYLYHAGDLGPDHALSTLIWESASTSISRFSDVTTNTSRAVYHCAQAVVKRCGC